MPALFFDSGSEPITVSRIHKVHKPAKLHSSTWKALWKIEKRTG
jgi:hypothetical protein